MTLTNGTPVPYELQEAIGAMCEECFGQKAKVRGVGGPVEDPMYLEAKETLGIHFRELPALATIRGRIIAPDAGTTEGGGVVAVGVMMTENGPEEDTAGGPGTAQDGEALALMTYVRALRDKEGVYWIVVHSEAAMGALRSYLRGDRSGDGVKRLNAQVVGDERLEGTAAINIVATPSH